MTEIVRTRNVQDIFLMTSSWLIRKTICLLLLICMCGCYSKKDPFVEFKQQIVVEDLEVLEDFFEYLLKHTSFGFTLLGHKPVSYECYWPPETSEELQGQRLRYGLLAEGWEVFQKYSHLFPEKYFFIAKEYDHLSRLSCITLANKQEVEKVVNKHLNLFREFYGENFSFSQYVDKLPSVFLEENLLAGILLGYGARNAWAFHRRAEISSLSTDLTSSKGFSSLEEELNYINDHCSRFILEHIADEFTMFTIPAFMSLDDDEEVNELADSYTKTLNDLHDATSKYSCLQIFYEKFAGRM